jgi:molybdate transport system substrate-binding protein
MPGRFSKNSLSRLLTVAAIVVISTISARAEEARVAAAANFTEAALKIGALFEASTGHRLIFSFGATGLLYTQITQDAPFDVFLAADQARPERAVTEGFAVPDSRFTYATGRLILYSRDPELVRGALTLRDANFQRIAIANPVSAPYGAAAVETMQRLGVYEALQPKIVRGNNISQAYQFVATGNAELGFVAPSQIPVGDKGSRWSVPDNLHAQIAQDAVLLRRGRDNAAAVAFLKFLKGPEAEAVREEYGYGDGG